MTKEQLIQIEGSLKIGDEIIITQCNNIGNVSKLAIVAEIDREAIGRVGIFAIKFRLPSGFESWCRAVPASSLLKELF